MGFDDDEESPGRALLTGVGAMAAVALVVGLVVGLVVLGTLKLTTGGGGSGGDAAAPASVFIPPYQPTETVPESWPGLPSPGDVTESESQEPTTEPATEPPGEILLVASPQQVAPSQRINLSGSFPAGNGTTLQVQRLEGGHWNDFPVTASVKGGGFATWIQTSRTGETKLRVLDPRTGRKSNVVTVQIG